MDIHHVLCLSASLPLFRALTLSLSHALTSSLTRTRRGKIPSTRILVHSILHAGNAACTIIADGVVSVKLDEVCGAVGLEVAGVVVVLIDDVGAGLVGGGVVTKVSMLQSAPVQPSSQMHVPSLPLQRPLPLHIVNILHCLMHSLEYMFSSHALQPTPEKPSGQPPPSGVVCGAVVVGVVLKVVVGAGVVLEVLVGEGVVLEVVGAGLVVVLDKVVAATVVVLQDVVRAGVVVEVVRVSVVVVGDGVAWELVADVCYGHTNDDDDCLVQAYT
jgi:hypothetical protein